MDWYSSEPNTMKCSILTISCVVNVHYQGKCVHCLFSVGHECRGGKVCKNQGFELVHELVSV